MYSIPNLPDPLARAIYAELCTLLPSPATATPEGRASRDERAMTAVAHYLPENAAEAELAAQIVAADFHAKDALRSAAAALAVDDAPEAGRCRAQAASMMRQMHAGVRTLQRMQAERHKAEDALRPFAMQRAGYWFRETTVPEPQPVPAPVAEAPEPPPPATAPANRPFEAMTPGEQFAVLYPDRALQIRATGGMPVAAKYPPPDPEVLEEVVKGNSPILRALDQHPVAAAAE